MIHSGFLFAGHESSKITMDIYVKVKYNRPERIAERQEAGKQLWSVKVFYKITQLNNISLPGKIYGKITSWYIYIQNSKYRQITLIKG